MPLNLDSLATSSALVSGGSAQPAPKNTPPDAFVIRENIASGALEVILEDTDTPYGRPREVSGFQSGGKVDIAQGGIYNPGSNRVVLQMMAVRENKLVIKGAFRDRIRAGAQAGENSNHARSMRDRLEEIKRRGNPLKISWSGDERLGVLEEAVYDEEGPHDIGYTLTFFIAVPPSGITENRGSTSPTPSIEELRAEMAENVAAQRADAVFQAADAAKTAILSNALTAVSSAIDTLGTFTTNYERTVLSTPQRVQVEVNAINAAANNVQAQIETIYNQNYDDIPADEATVNASIDAYMQWWVWQSTTRATLDQTHDAMRQVRLQAREQLNARTRLYRVQPDDTLESIAFTQLGSKARASDLNVRPDQLIPGKYIRIPLAV